MNQQNHQWSLSFRYVIFGVLFITIAAGIWYIRRILEPIIIAAFIAYLLHPLVNFLLRHSRMTRPTAVNLVYFVALVILIGTPSTLTPLFFDEFQQVITDTLRIFDQFITWLKAPLVVPGIPLDFGQIATRLTQFRSTFLTSLPDQAIQLLGKTSITALWVLVILVTIYYFLAEWPRLRNGFINSFPDVYQAELNELYQRVRGIWMNYLRGQLLLMAIVGVTFSIAWMIIGIPGALVLGVAAGFLTLIPDVGPFIAAALAASVALLEGSNWSWMPASSFIVMLIVVATYLVLISIKNFWLRPFIMGRSVHMHEALVLISIIMSTMIWGILGALLVVPVLASMGVIFDYLRRRILGLPPFPATEPFVLTTPPASGSEKVAVIKSKISKKKQDQDGG
jgi:predicted PurR-regulated permease PerM